MAKIYGERWQISDSSALGRGGQAEVFRVVDLRGEYSGFYALKRVLNPERRERFRREIEAIKTIDHPNVIKLVDHSALDDTTGQAEKQFIVMPIADGGDLDRPGRVDLYRGSIDAVIQVGKQLASALAAAHAAKVIHRDVKPGNILFTGLGHEVWLSDFGICLLREQPRLTDSEEVVGPRAFLAPELEEGSQLDVTPAADAYSLGKVLYYMISGGTILPRERLGEEKYSSIFRQGERFELLQLLLQQMICGLSGRIQHMDQVGERLRRIEDWEKSARLLPISKEGLASIQKLHAKALELERVSAEDKSIRAQEKDRLQAVQRGFKSWAQTELERVAEYINSLGSFICKVNTSEFAGNLGGIPGRGGGYFNSIADVGLSLGSQAGAHAEKYILQISLCTLTVMQFKVTLGNEPPPPPVAEPMKDFQLAMIPYAHTPKGGRHAGRPAGIGYFTKKEFLGRIVGHFPAGAVPGTPRIPAQVGPLKPVTLGFLNGCSQITEFRVSDWPEAVSILRPALQEAVDSFIAFVESGGRISGA